MAEASDEMSHEDRVKYLRERGVEIDLVYDKTKKTGGPKFRFVCIPVSGEMYEEEAEADDGDVLKSYLAPRFADDGDLDEATVERETRGVAANMVAQAEFQQPSVETIKKLGRQGQVEAYPLARGQTSVQLYLDEIGVLRQRPRNTKAEHIAAEVAGLTGLSICGDVYVGRTSIVDGKLRNVAFSIFDLDPGQPWARQARLEHHELHAANTTEMKKGNHESYSWTQNDDDLEISVVVPSEFLALGPITKKRVTLKFPHGGIGLHLAIDTMPILSFPKLFDKVIPDDASWCLDDSKSSIILSIDKATAREWAMLHLDEPTSTSPGIHV